jgi:hypothetical protein
MTPQQAVEDWVRRIAEQTTPEQAVDAPGGAMEARPAPPVLERMEIVRHRDIPGRQIHALTYRDVAGDRWSWIVRLIQDDEGSWRVCGGGGGIGNGPERDGPWINLAGCWGEHGLAIGGWVADPGAMRAASARLRTGDEVQADDVEHGVVLFVTSERVAASAAIVELLAPDGSILWRDELELD